MELRQGVLRDVTFFFDDTRAMKKLQLFLQHLKMERMVQEEEELTPAEKQEVLNGIRSGLQEVKAARAGNVKLQSARDFLHEIRS